MTAWVVRVLWREAAARTRVAWGGLAVREGDLAAAGRLGGLGPGQGEGPGGGPCPGGPEHGDGGLAAHGGPGGLGGALQGGDPGRCSLLGQAGELLELVLQAADEGAVLAQAPAGDARGGPGALELVVPGRTQGLGEAAQAGGGQGGGREGGPAEEEREEEEDQAGPAGQVDPAGGVALGQGGLAGGEGLWLGQPGEPSPQPLADQGQAGEGVAEHGEGGAGPGCGGRRCRPGRGAGGRR